MTYFLYAGSWHSNQFLHSFYIVYVRFYRLIPLSCAKPFLLGINPTLYSIWTCINICVQEACKIERMLEREEKERLRKIEKVISSHIYVLMSWMRALYALTLHQMSTLWRRKLPLVRVTNNRRGSEKYVQFFTSTSAKPLHIHVDVAL